MRSGVRAGGAIVAAAALTLAACGGDDDGGGSSALSGALADIPEECRDQMENFLVGIEPILDDVDWDAATLADFEAVGADFEARSAELQSGFDEAGCDDLDLGEDEGFDLLVDFARDVAPGTVGFFEFLEGMIDSTTAAVDPSASDGDGESGGAFADCGDAIDYVEQLMNDYDSLLEAPAADLLAFTELPSVLGSCTPDQLEFLESPEVTDFMSE